MATPPYTITAEILRKVSEIQILLGEARNLQFSKPDLKLRKESQIKTIHHSLAIEGNTIAENQISALLEGKRVLGPKDQIQEVKNALDLYSQISSFDPLKEKDLLKAHKILMQDLIGSPGKYRAGAVGIFKNDQVARIAPPSRQVPNLMGSLFSFLNNDKTTLPLLKACIFHYELELIHPFQDGNGRMGRLWQQLLLMKISPIFELIAIESLIHKNQKQYYSALEKSDTAGESTPFIEFSLEMILEALSEFSSSYTTRRPTTDERLEAALAHFAGREFSRKEYIQFLKDISTATASRDLAKAVSQRKLKRSGEKAQARYRQIKSSSRGSSS